MGSSKPQPVKAPFESREQQQATTANTYGRFSIADSPEAQNFLSAPLDFGDPTNVDPGVGRRTDLAEQRAGDEWNSAFMGGLPAEYRKLQRDSELRRIRGQGAAEAQQAQYLNQQGNNQRRGAVTQANIGRLERVLPQYFQTGGTTTGSGSTSGFNTQIVQPQPGFWQRLALGVAQGAASGLKIPGLGG